MNTISIGEYTDIGGGKENQDASLVIETNRVLLLAVMDGHGKTDGKKNAEFCKSYISSKFDWLIGEEGGERKGEEDVEKRLDELFGSMHHALAVQIIQEKEAQGETYRHDTFGAIVDANFLGKKPLITGGTTATIALLWKDTQKLVVANVGDSEAILCLASPSAPSACLPRPELHVVLTEIHSPNNVKEYGRIMDDPMVIQKPGFIYDNPAVSYKLDCTPIYDYQGTVQLPCLPCQGYYKNINEEFATYIVTPNNNMLAMTRSIGDFPLVPFGCSCKPFIRTYQLSQMQTDATKEVEEGEVDEGTRGKERCLVLATDGVWDNWTKEGMQEFVMFHNCLETVESNRRIGGQRVATSLGERNSLLGIRHFGKARDNATLLLAYL